MTEASRLLEMRASGLYRIQGSESSGLAYIGEGLIAYRIRDHQKSALLSNSRKSSALAAARDLKVSWVVNADWSKTQRLELEVDLIAAHLIATNVAPSAQFGGVILAKDKS